MLYQPRHDPRQKRLEISKFAVNSSTEQFPLSKQTFETFSQDLEYVSQPLYSMLGKFGILVPDVKSQRRTNVGPGAEMIMVSSICYATLRRVCEVEIKWVDSLSLHLNFDSGRKVLHVLRVPSFCRLMYRRKRRTMLSQYVTSRYSRQIAF